MKNTTLFFLVMLFFFPMSITANTLEDAVKMGNYAEVKKTLENSSKVDQGVLNKALSDAVHYGQIEIIPLLIEHGANVNLGLGGIKTLVSSATIDGRADIVQLLIKNGADVNGGINSGYFPLSVAVKSNSIELVKLLLVNGADPNSESSRDFPPLLSAVRNRSVEIINLLLKHGADPVAGGVRGNNSMTLAVKENSPEILELLLKNSIKEIQGIGFYEPLMLALSKARTPKNKECIRLLLEADDLQSMPPEYFSGLLIETMDLYEIEIFKLLLEKKVDINFNDVFYKACSLGAFEIVKDIYGKTLDLDLNDAFIKACNSGSLNTVKFVYEKADIDLNTYGPTALRVAVGNTEVMKFLLEKNVNPNISGIYKNTVLQLTADRSLSATLLLLMHGADVNAQEGNDNDGDTVLMTFTRFGNVRGARLLLDFGAKVDARDKGGDTALIFASRYGYHNRDSLRQDNNNIKMIELLLDYGADINAQDNNGETALLKALQQTYRDRTSTVTVLLERNADIDIKSKFGRTAAKLIAENAKLTDILKNIKKRDDSKIVQNTPSTRYSNLLVSPKPQKPGIALIMPYKKDNLSFDAFRVDGKNDSLIKVLAESASPIVGVRLETIGGKVGVWKTKDVKADKAGVIMVEHEGQRINPHDSSFALDVKHPTEIDLIIQDNGAFVDEKNKLRVTFFHKDKTRSYAIPMHIKPAMASNLRTLLKNNYQQDLNLQLIRAVNANKIFLVKELIDQGADMYAERENFEVRSVDQEGSALVAAIRAKDRRILELLLNEYHNPKKLSYRNEMMSFRHAVIYNKLDAVKLLHKHGFNIHFADAFDGRTILMNAAKRLGIAKYLIEQGVDVNARDKAGWTALLDAVHADNLKMVELMLANGADVNLGPYYQATLDYAKSQKNPNQRIIELLEQATVAEVRNKADVELEKAVENKDYNAVKKAFENGADPHALTLYGYPIFFLAAYQMKIPSDSAIFELFIENNVDVNMKDFNGFNLIGRPGWENIEIYKYFAEKGVDFNIVGKSVRGAAPFTMRSNLQIIDAYLDNGRDVNIRGKNGVTMLMSASFHRDSKLVEYLLSRGADANLKDIEGKTALDALDIYYGTPAEEAAIRQLLLEAMKKK